MKERIKRGLSTGITRLKWLADYVAQRTKAETKAARLLFESSKIELKMDEIYRDIGKRVFELKEKEKKDETHVFGDFIIQQAIDEIRKLREKVEDLKNKAREISKLPE